MFLFRLWRRKFALRWIPIWRYNFVYITIDQFYDSSPKDGQSYRRKKKIWKKIKTESGTQSELLSKTKSKFYQKQNLKHNHKPEKESETDWKSETELESES